MDFEDITVVHEVARLGSMTQAAETLGYAQSSITQRIRKLEQTLNVPLFYRTAKGVHLTPAGQLFVKQGLKITRLFEELHQQLSPTETPHGLLRIGSMETTAAVHLPALLKRYHGQCPNVELSLTTGTTAALTRQILEYKLDLAFVAAAVNHPDIAEQEVFHEELVLVAEKAAAAHSLPELLQTRTILVFHSGCVYRALLEQYLLEQNLLPLQRFEFGSLEAILGAVAAGLGITLLPRSVIADKLQTDALIVYELPPSQRHCATLLIQRKDTPPSSAITAFMGLFR